MGGDTISLKVVVMPNNPIQPAPVSFGALSNVGSGAAFRKREADRTRHWKSLKT